MIEQNERTVAEIVRRYLVDCHPEGLTFEVLYQEIRRGEFGWKVLVLLSHEPARLFHYYEALADVEIALADEAGLDVLLVPAFAEAA